MCRVIKNLLVSGLVVGALMVPVRANAGPITFTQGSLSASAEFTLVGGNLQVDLKNTAKGDVWDPASVLTGIFFDFGGDPTLTPLTAKIGTCLGCGVTNGGLTDAGGLVNGEWAFKGGKTDLAYGANYGISSSGLGVFGPKDLFPGGTSFYGPNPGGVGYGITTLDDNPLTNGGLKGVPLIANEVIFTLSGTGIDLSKITNVTFQYGTALYETTPEPATIALFGPAVVAAWFVRRRRKAA
jgi:hypothetical protein